MQRFNSVLNNFYVGAYARDDIDGCTLEKNKYSSSSTLEIRILIRKKKITYEITETRRLVSWAFSSHSFIDGAGWSPSRQIPTIMTLEQTNVHTNHNSLLLVEGCHDFRLINYIDMQRRSYLDRLTCSFDLPDILHNPLF